MSKKKLLLIAGDFFGYIAMIKELLIYRGYAVTKISPTAMDCNLLFHVIEKLMGEKNRGAIDSIYLDKKVTCDNDVVFVIKGATLTPENIKEIRRKNPKARFIIWNWDSVQFNPNFLQIAEYFDDVYTFDKVDSNNYGWKYRPVFYSEESNLLNRKYDLLFVGSFKPGREKIVRKLKSIAEAEGLNAYIHMAVSPFGFIIKRFILNKPEYSNLKISDVRFRPISMKKLMKLTANSKIIVECLRNGQNGYSWRVADAISHRCKLVTNNPAVRVADFENSNIVYVYDENNFDIPKSFIDAPYLEPPHAAYCYYSAESFLDTILENA